MCKQRTTENFIERAIKVHKNIYDYSKVNYNGTHAKVIIGCNKHGFFTQVPNHHLSGHGCNVCAVELRSSNKNDFIKKSIETHGDLYDYSKVDYKGSRVKVEIECKEHGIFKQRPDCHINGQGCKICSGRKSNTANFILKAKVIYGDLYNYDKSVYINNSTKVEIGCKKHGFFMQTPQSHYKSKGCHYCKSNSKSNTNEFILKAITVHEDLYDYNNVDYKGTHTKVEIKCKKHGIFKQTPVTHLNGNGCGICSGNIKSNSQEFILKAKAIHGDLYDYRNVNYINNSTKIEIGCKKHGIFKQTPAKHLKNQGCGNCNLSKGELLIKKWLDNNNISYEQQKKFPDCKNKQKLSFDFYLKQYSTLIEFQGVQHYKPVNYWKGMQGLVLQQFNDKIKKEYVNNNGYTLLEINHELDNQQIIEILTKTIQK
jgi:hypothetical protein